MSATAIQPPDFMPSAYAPAPRPRVASLPGFVSLGVDELFPEFPQPIYTDDTDDVAAIRRVADFVQSRLDDPTPS